MANDYTGNQNADTSDTSSSAQTNFLPESPDTPTWGPPSGLPESPDTPTWGPPPGLPESPDTPTWGPPSGNGPTVIWPPTGLPDPSDRPGWGPIIVPDNSGNSSNSGSFGNSGNLNWRPVITFPGITIQPNTSGTRSSSVRFIHAAVGQGQVTVSVNGSVFTSYLIYSNMTEYQTVTGGTAAVTVRSNTTGRVINRTSFSLDDGGIYTIALVNSADGVALYLMEDTSCNKSVYNSCIRTANLTNRAPSLDVALTGGSTLFSGVRFLDVTDYRQFNPGTYSISVTSAGGCGVVSSGVSSNSRAVQILPVIVGIGGSCGREVFATSTMDVGRNRVYTLYLIGNAYASPQLQMILAESYFEY